MSKQRKYELICVLSPDMTEEAVGELRAQIEAAVQKFDGRIDRSENWGRRRLAYEIGRHKEGIYLLEVIDGGGDLMKEIDRRLKVNEQVLRHLVVRVDEQMKAIERTRARRQAEALKRGTRGPAPEGAASAAERAEIEPVTDHGEEA